MINFFFSLFSRKSFFLSGIFIDKQLTTAKTLVNSNACGCLVYWWQKKNAISIYFFCFSFKSLSMNYEYYFTYEWIFHLITHFLWFIQLLITVLSFVGGSIYTNLLYIEKYWIFILKHDTMISYNLLWCTFCLINSFGVMHVFNFDFCLFHFLPTSITT